MSVLSSTPSATSDTTPPPLILLVEDDEDTRFLYAETLIALGYRTAGEGDAQGGIEAAFRLRPDVVLMDLSMPGMSALEAIRTIKADPRTSGCLVVVVTGSGMKSFEGARAAGCDAFFMKPFDPSVLDHLLRALPHFLDVPVAPLPCHVVKRCTCGREFTRSQWLELPVCGRIHVARNAVPVELRNCRCGSSMMLQVGRGESAMDGNAKGEPGGGEAPKKVLVVDRDVHVRRLVLHFIGSAYLVEFLDDGYSALDRVRKSPPAALVAEVMIPRLDGLAVCRLLKGDACTSKVPVLLFSVLDANERARQAGADAFLNKPLEKGRFVDSLLRITEPVATVAGAASRQERGEP
jgi:CheY-like chemotaxis protein